MVAFLLFGSMLGLFAIGVPIAFGLGISTVLALLYSGKVPLILVAQRVFVSLDSFPIMAVLLFLLAGGLMDAGGMSSRLIKFSSALLGQFRAGLALVTVGASMLFAGVSGSSSADTAAVGSIMIPAMVKRGYHPGFVTAIQAAAGAIGPIIPPSIIMIVLGSVTNSSIGELFLGGVVPGILIGFSLMIVSYLHARRGGAAYLATETFAWGRLWETFWRAIPGLGMPVIILGGILTGVFTATEAAAVAVVYGFLVGMFGYRELHLGQMPRILVDAACRSGMVLLIIGTAGLFAWLVASEQVPLTIAALLQRYANNWVTFLILVNILLFSIGMFMESIAAIVILMPILYPVAQTYGIDPIHLGVVVTVNLCIGMVTPPYGITLFVSCSLSRLSVRQVTPALVPPLIAMVMVQMLISFIPPLVTFIPQWFMR